MAEAARLDHVGLAVADLAAEAGWFCEVFGLVPELRLRVEALDLSIEMLIHPGHGYRVELLHRPGERRARPGRGNVPSAPIRECPATRMRPAVNRFLPLHQPWLASPSAFLWGQPAPAGPAIGSQQESHGKWPARLANLPA